MKLTVHERKSLKKGETNKIRREGNIPGVLYGKGKENRNIVINGEELRAVLRGLKSGLLSTTIFNVHDGKQNYRAIIKDIHYHVADYSILHIDLTILEAHQPIAVNVPIQVVGVADCVGVKLGGFLRQVIRSMKVSCLPKDIPQEFVLDVRELNITQSKRLSDIVLPSLVRPLAKLTEIAVVIAKK